MAASGRRELLQLGVRALFGAPKLREQGLREKYEHAREYAMARHVRRRRRRWKELAGNPFSAFMHKDVSSTSTEPPTRVAAVLTLARAMSRGSPVAINRFAPSEFETRGASRCMPRKGMHTLQFWKVDIHMLHVERCKVLR